MHGQQIVRFIKHTQPKILGKFNAKQQNNKKNINIPKFNYPLLLIGKGLPFFESQVYILFAQLQMYKKNCRESDYFCFLVVKDVFSRCVVCVCFIGKVLKKFNFVKFTFQLKQQEPQLQ
eukprot:TRINITY_DN10980_c0_g1_i2.p3 TRINITY_DN10980_c0_g1~~TRINITY_DN10980_c0_g1_i2.p3  ORF type:complete len:119 (-),score=1.15 TRINITY_DN10980_c0_g1_i2:421-777(-)